MDGACLMRKAMNSWLARTIGVVRRLFRPQVVECRCISFRGTNSIEFRDCYLETAEELDIQVTVRWPIMAGGVRRRRLEVELEPKPVSGLICWEQVSLRGRTTIRVRLQAEEASATETLRLAIRESRQARHVAEIEFRRLEPGAAQQLRLARLRAEDIRLCVLSDGHQYQSNLVAESSEAVFLEFSLARDTLSDFLPDIAASLELRVLANRTRCLLSQFTIELKAGVVKVTTPSLMLADKSLLRPGSCSLEVALANRTLVRQEFRLVSETEVLQQVRVRCMHMAAQRRNGETVRGLKVLRWEEHQAILPWMQVETGVLAPNTRLRCVVRTFQGRTFLNKELIVLKLDRHSLLVRLKRMELAGLGLPGRNKASRLSLSVHWAGEQKASLAVVVLPPERLTNWEGQLKMDARHLPLDEVEYDQIVRGLGMREVPMRRWRLWQWLMPSQRSE